MESSDLWKSIINKYFNSIDSGVLTNFRSPGEWNSRLASFDPISNDSRYFKTLLYSIANAKTDHFFDLYSKLEDVNLGNPLFIKIRDLKINIDHLLAVDEFIFLEENLNFFSISSVLEIGGGFGRTCETILKLANNIDTYTIVDLPEVLNLSKLYLRQAIPDLIHKVIFQDATLKNQISGTDLIINVDSFQEMQPDVIDYYFENFVNHSKFFYCKNPVGKYLPESVDIAPNSHIDQNSVFQLGYCQNIVDIFDETSLKEAEKYYLSKYAPKVKHNDNPIFKIVHHESLEIIPYYHHALWSKIHIN